MGRDRIGRLKVMIVECFRVISRHYADGAQRKLAVALKGAVMPRRASRSPKQRSSSLRDNGLLLACLGLFAVFFVGMILAGTATYNQEQLEHGSSSEQVSMLGYLTTGHFVEATFENWESEFLQMGMYVVLTAFFYQKGSSESKPIGDRTPQDVNPRDETVTPRTQWPVRRGGWVLVVYENSLAIAFFGSVALHAVGGSKAFNEEQLQHGQAAISAWRYMTTSQFWRRGAPQPNGRMTGHNPR